MYVALGVTQIIFTIWSTTTLHLILHLVYFFKKRLFGHQPYFILLNTILINYLLLCMSKITNQDQKTPQNFYNKILTSDKLINLKHDLKNTQIYIIMFYSNNSIQDEKRTQAHAL